MKTAPASAPCTTSTDQPQELLCFFLSSTHAKQFHAGHTALTLCGEWVTPNASNTAQDLKAPIKANQIPCPRCMNIRYSNTGGL